MVDKIDFAQTSYILGILSIVFALVTPLVGLVIGVIGLIQSTKQKNNLSKYSKKLNIIGIVANVLVFVLTAFFLIKSGNTQILPVA